MPSLYRLGAEPPALIAAGWALAGPRLLYLLQPVVGGRSFLIVGQAEGLVSLFFTGGCPALTWVPFVIAGMAVVRLDLAATAVPIRLALTGVARAVVGYGRSWQALRLVSGAAAAVREAKTGSSMPSMSPGSVGLFGAPTEGRPPARWWGTATARAASGRRARARRRCGAVLPVSVAENIALGTGYRAAPD